MIKHILFIFIFSVTLFSSVIKTPILTYDAVKELATIKIDKVDIGVSGFVVHKLSEKNSAILRDAVVVGFDAGTKTATLKLSEFTQLKQNSLPHGNWSVEVGDTAILAFGYSRALLIAPSEEVYYRVTKATTQVQWLHPDLFATILSFSGHPTPLKEDFRLMSNTTSVGLIFFFLDNNIYTVDANSMAVLNISDAPIKQDTTKLPFYSRVEQIDANWWGEGSDELEDYEPYYFNLLISNNPNNSKLKELYNKYLNKR